MLFAVLNGLWAVGIIVAIFVAILAFINIVLKALFAIAKGIVGVIKAYPLLLRIILIAIACLIVAYLVYRLALLIWKDWHLSAVTIPIGMLAGVADLDFKLKFMPAFGLALSMVFMYWIIRRSPSPFGATLATTSRPCVVAALIVSIPGVIFVDLVK
jgi:hypothetical protein